jgi:KDO2-lipid IV(A) lauroyltransferase
MLPIEVASSMTGKLAELIGPRLKVSKVAYKNLSKCFPEMSFNQKQDTIKKMWNNLGRMVGEIPHWQKMSSEEYKKRVTFIDHSKGEFHQIKTGLFLSGHFGNWELIPKIIKELQLKLYLIYRPANNSYVDHIINKTREKDGIYLIKKGMTGLKDILHNLQKGCLVGMLIDQKTNSGIDVPFFNFPAKTTPAPAHLAIKLGVPMVIGCVRRTKGANYEIEIMPPILPKKDDDVVCIMTKLNTILENWIKRDPHLWFWVHKRWKPEFYES